MSFTRTTAYVLVLEVLYKQTYSVFMLHVAVKR